MNCELGDAIEKVKSITGKQLQAVLEQYPNFEKVYSLLLEFKAMFYSKEATHLNQAKSLDIREINSFLEGLKRDLTAMINAIILPYSNGLAEGKINKLKLIKRIMYGRCNFDTLRVKVLLLENHGIFN